MQGAKVHITGIVQGVGFRPFVYNLAVSLNLKGWVKNTSAGVHIEVDGDQETLDIFLQKLRDDAPPLSRIDDFSASFGPGNGFTQFDIIHSESVDGAFQPISPDVAICDDCLRELFDPTDRRYRYPFINCTNCGPRFTIIQDIPYDRPFTTMAGFPLCPDCEREYKDPTNRRFHAQPVACAVCGPKVWLEMQNAEVGGQNTEGRRQKAEGGIQNDEAVVETQRLLAEGKIVAIKGLGGFHLACDATNASAVTELRTRKLRVDKPFALMMPDLETIEQHCFVSDEEKALLTSPAHPIVLLKKKPESTIVEEVSPKQDWLGVMLPYTPLHYLLFSNQHSPISALVMTSGNLSEEPIATDNAEARERLANLADAFLMHDRDIHVRCDDSVVRVFSEQSPITNHQLPITYPIRRSRGYSPFPVKLPFEVPPLLATGSELKNTFCLTNRNYAFLSHHIGDMENYETLKSFEQGVEHFERLFRVKPVAIAHDMHPNYLATRYALERAERENLPTFAIQHHYAHVAACMAEHGLSEPVIGVSFDGTGYGDDGAIWGGEFLVADYKSYQRAAHLEYFPLPGGDAAIKKPARAALALLWSLGMDWDDALESVKEFCAEDQVVLRVQLEKKINTPMTSSMGRLFDAVSALAGVRQKVNYEGQAAIEFEAMVDSAEAGHYAFGVESGQVRVRSVVEALVKDVMAGVSTSKISARFHHGLAEAVCETVQKIHGETSLRKVILSGGVWQNLTLLRRTLSLLREDGFEVYIHREVPTNDGGLSLGQAAIAAFRLRG
ncbi:MAG: carbamoyltransferase HypF [Anaerolineales bacterium]|nr:carbamoyltransferase HypF [Anaerolineales bacterium]MCB9144518.1 carbamoyltransferase HypF [Anaerolineales bacterium]